MPPMRLYYNAQNMPSRIEVIKNGQVAASDFLYDEGNQRVRKSTNSAAGGKTTYYVSPEFEVVNGVGARYIFAGNQRVAQVVCGEQGWFHKDHLGSTNALTRADGGFAEKRDYAGFGWDKLLAGSAKTTRTFTDHEEDAESDLIYMRARYYDPSVGRFISADTILPFPHDPQQLNRYAYCRNDPLKYTDPTGHFADPASVGIGAAIGAIGAAIGAAALGEDAAGIGKAAAIGAAIGALGAMADTSMGVSAGIGAALGVTEGVASGAGIAGTVCSGVAGALGGVVGKATAPLGRVGEVVGAIKSAQLGIGFGMLGKAIDKVAEALGKKNNKDKDQEKPDPKSTKDLGEKDPSGPTSATGPGNEENGESGKGEGGKSSPESATDGKNGDPHD